MVVVPVMVTTTTARDVNISMVISLIVSFDVEQCFGYVDNPFTEFLFIEKCMMNYMCGRMDVGVVGIQCRGRELGCGQCPWTLCGGLEMRQSGSVDWNEDLFEDTYLSLVSFMSLLLARGTYWRIASAGSSLPRI
jgi:hypothetical protein